jgi:hypothetical protein
MRLLRLGLWKGQHFVQDASIAERFLWPEEGKVKGCLSEKQSKRTKYVQNENIKMASVTVYRAGIDGTCRAGRLNQVV